MSNKKKSGKKPRLSFKKMMKNMGRLLKYLWKYYPIQFILVIVFILISSAASVLGSLFMGRIIDFIDSDQMVKAASINDARFDLLGQKILLMAGIYVLGIAGNYGYQRLTAVMSQGVQKRIRDELFNHMESLPLRYFDSRPRGDIMSIYTNDIDSLREMLSRSVPLIFSSVVTMVVVLVAMIISSWILTMIVLGFFIIELFVILYVTKQSAKYFIAQQIALAAADGYIEELTTGQKVIKVFNYEDRNKEVFPFQ